MKRLKLWHLTVLLFLVGAYYAAASSVTIAQIAYNLVQNAGVPLVQRQILNCSTGMSCSDDAGGLRTTLTATGTGGSVTNVATGCGLSGGPVTTTGTILASFTVNAHTTTSEAILNADCGKLDTFSNAGAVAVSIAQAGSGGLFVSGWSVWLENLGAGTVTITPATSTIDGAATLTLTTNQGVQLFSDGTNYFTQRGRSTAVGSVNSGTLGQGGYYAAAGTSISGFSVTGIPNFRDGVGAPIAAVAANVTSLFSGCSGTQYLGADGACHAATLGNLAVSGACLTDGTNNYLMPLLRSITAAANTTFAWVNQNTATVATSGCGVQMTAPLTAGDQVEARCSNPPMTTSFTVIAAFIPGIQPITSGGNTNNRAFVAFRESATAKLVLYSLTADNTSNTPWNRQNYTNPTTFSAQASDVIPFATNPAGSTNVGQTLWPFFWGPVWVRLVYDGTNLLYSYSYDQGVTFVQLRSESKTAFFTTAPDQVCWGADPQSGAANPLMIHWLVTSP